MHNTIIVIYIIYPSTSKITKISNENHITKTIHKSTTHDLIHNKNKLRITNFDSHRTKNFCIYHEYLKTFLGKRINYLQNVNELYTTIQVIQNIPSYIMP